MGEKYIMEGLVDRLIDLCIQYDGLFQIRYYGNGLSSVTFKTTSGDIKIKFTGKNLRKNLQFALDKAYQKLVTK